MNQLKRMGVATAVALAMLAAPAMQGSAAAKPPPPAPGDQQACADPAVHTQNKRQIVFPNGSEMTLTAWVCIYYEPSAAWNNAFVEFDVGDGDNDFLHNPNDNFYFFDIQVRLENHDSVIASTTYDWAAIYQGINYDAATGRHVCGSDYFYQPDYFVGDDMTADATVTYDIKGDGKGTFTWDLYGSPPLY